MTVTYGNGISVEGLLLSSDGGTVRVAIPGENDVRTLTRVDDVWRTENGQAVQVSFAWQRDAARPAPVPEESHFVCSEELGRQLISSLMNGSEMNEPRSGTFYVFSAEKRRLNITVLRGQESRAS
jgi:hypothetical protein